MATTHQGLIHYTAGCLECSAEIVARNAQAWAHNHSRRTGHAVELSLGWRVTCEGAPEKPKAEIRRKSDDHNI